MDRKEAFNNIKEICKWLEENDKRERERKPKLQAKRHFEDSWWYVHETSLSDTVRNWCGMLLEAVKIEMILCRLYARKDIKLEE